MDPTDFGFPPDEQFTQHAAQHQRQQRPSPCGLDGPCARCSHLDAIVRNFEALLDNHRLILEEHLARVTMPSPAASPSPPAPAPSPPPTAAAAAPLPAPPAPPPAAPAAPQPLVREEMLTVDEAAAVLSVNRKTLYAAIREGHGPPVVRLGRSLRISRTALLDWVRGNGVRPTLGGVS